MNSPAGEIWFYAESEKPYGVFSNFYPSKIIIAGKEYPNSEAYFQSMKFMGANATEDDLEYADIIRRQNTGNKAAILARQRKPRLTYQWGKDLWVIIQEYNKRGVAMRKDWETIKDNVMRRAVYQKFSQNERLKKILLGTGNNLLFEHTHRDPYWADGHPINNPNVHGDGKNMLGIILEEVRYLLGGQLSSRFTHMHTFEYSNWVIPGMFMMSGCPRRENFLKLKQNGFQYFISLMDYDQEQELKIDYRGKDFKDPGKDFCRATDNVVIARWGIVDRAVTDDSRAIEIALTVIMAIGHGYPTVLHCFGGKGRAGTISSLIIGLLYGENGDEAVEIAERLFHAHRPNKGRKLAGKKGTPKCLKRDIPQTQAQFNQIKRILKKPVEDRAYGYFN